MYTNQRQNEDTKELRRLGGRWLKERREHAGLSQRQLAEILGVEYYTFISQIETGHGRIPPDRYETWASAIGLELSDFVREILRYYDPVTFAILFGNEMQMTASGSQRDMLAGDSRTREASGSENRQLQEQVRELQRLLGKKTMELEQLRERLTSGNGNHVNRSGTPSTEQRPPVTQGDTPPTHTTKHRHTRDVAAAIASTPSYGQRDD